MRIYPNVSPKACCFVSMITLSIMAACQTPSITFKPLEGDVVSASLVDFTSLEDNSEELGKLPVTLENEKIAGKVLKLSQAGRESQYWVFPELPGEENTATVKFIAPPLPNADAKDPASADMNPSRRNIIVRLLLKSYQALSGRKFDMAIQFAEQASNLDPVLAGPYLLKALILTTAISRPF
jgi:hypothetical protein